jgi:alpha 1,6-mannosyltransferase
LQIVQWTFAAAPLHPILIDAIRRVHYTTAMVEANKLNKNAPNGVKEHWVGGELLRNDGSTSIMEWTGRLAILLYYDISELLV